MMNIPSILTSLDTGGDSGDNCDAWGAPLPIHASSAVASDPNVRVDPALTTYQAPQAVVAQDPLSRGPIDPASPAPAPQPTVDSTVGKAEFMKRIVSDVGVARRFAAINVMEGDRRERLKKNEITLHPEIRAARLRNLAACTNSFEELGEIHKMLAELETQDVKHISDAAIRLAWRDVEPSRVACIDLLETSITVADRIAEEVKADEAELFAKYDLKREPTSISRKIASVKGDLERTLSAVRGGDGRNPQVPVMPIRHCPSGHELDHALMLFAVGEQS